MIGRIICSNGGNYQVHLENKKTVTCRCCGKLRNIKLSKESSFNYSKNKKSNKLETTNIKLSPKVGDFVEVELSTTEAGTIQDILPRKNEMIRPDIANVDQIMLICSAKEPDFSSYLLDLFLVNIEHERIKPIIIVSKIDLLTDSEYSDLQEKMKYYEDLNYKVIFTNSLGNVNVDKVREELKDKVTVLAGQTGAGKSSLINALIPGIELDTQEISQALGRGKHTTRVASLYMYADGFIGDTPGFSKIDLTDIKDTELSQYFVEFRKYPCKFSSCKHLPNSLGCGIYGNSEIMPSRFENYLKILEKTKR